MSSRRPHVWLDAFHEIAAEHVRELNILKDGEDQSPPSVWSWALKVHNDPRAIVALVHAAAHCYEDTFVRHGLLGNGRHKFEVLLTDPRKFAAVFLELRQKFKAAENYVTINGLRHHEPKVFGPTPTFEHALMRVRKGSNSMKSTEDMKKEREAALQRLQAKKDAELEAKMGQQHKFDMGYGAW